MAKTTQDTAKPKAPRSGSKLETLLAKLKSKKGASIDVLADSTGWQSHSVRAAITGLRKRGYEIERLTGGNGKTAYRCGRGAVL